MQWLVAVILVILLVLAAAVVAAAAAHSRARGARAALGGGNAVARWDGPATCYPKAMVAECMRLVHGSAGGRFGPAGPREAMNLAAEARRLSRKYGVPLGGGALLAMRDMEVALTAQAGGARARAHGAAMLAASRGGEPVVAIAERFRTPPMAALRQILLELGHSATAVQKMVADPEALMPTRLAREAEAIAEADLGSRLNAGRIRARSQAYEDALGAHLRRRLGLRFRTESDLRLAPDPRAPLLTPDFLLSEPVLIAGQEVHWVDAKDYPMYGSRLVARSLAQQAAKYTAAFGPGAMVFSGGVMCGAAAKSNLAVPLLLLDGSHVVAASSSAAITGSDGSTTAYPPRSAR